MKLYKATGIPQYSDSIPAVHEFEAESEHDARHWVINHCDCSLIWVVKEIK